MTPDLSTISGFAPKFSIFQRTRSASLPTATSPTRWLIPCVMALRRLLETPDDRFPCAHGLIVYLAMYRLTRPLSTWPVSPSSFSGPRK